MKESIEPNLKFKRSIYSDLLAWKDKKLRKPLLLMGARQIGKTTSLKDFGTSEYKDMLYINLEREVNTHVFFEGNKDQKKLLLASVYSMARISSQMKHCLYWMRYQKAEQH